MTGQEATATLNWYENDGTSECDNSSPLGHVAPTPTIDPIVEVGKDQKVYYCVSQTVDGCESELQQLTVVISDAPAPEVAPLSYCEGETASPLEASIITLTNPASAYTLQWYDASNNRLASAPTPLTTVNAGEKFTAHKYYVSQILTSTGAESTQSELVVTAYANQPLRSPTGHGLREDGRLDGRSQAGERGVRQDIHEGILLRRCGNIRIVKHECRKIGRILRAVHL